MVRNDFSALVIVLIILIVIICGFGYLLSDRIADGVATDELIPLTTAAAAHPIEPTRWAVTPVANSENIQAPAAKNSTGDVEAASTKIAVEIWAEELRATEIALHIKSTQIAEKNLATQTAPETQKLEAQVVEIENMQALRKSLPALLVGIIITGIVIAIIITLAIADRIHNDASLWQEEITYQRLAEQRRLAELRAAEQARRVREGAVRAPTAHLNVTASKNNGNGRASRKLPLAGR